MILVQVTWPDGSIAYFDLVGYCTLSSSVLEGTTVKLVNDRPCSSPTNTEVM